MINYAFKAGMEYKINGRNYLYANGMVKTEPPTFDNSFVSPRVRNDEVTGITSENVYSAELGYQYKSPIVIFKTSLFYTETRNAIQNRTFYHDDYRTFVNYSLSGIGKRQYGAEIGLDAKIYKGFSTNFVANIGKYQYSTNAIANVTADNSSSVLAANQVSYLKNYYLGMMPQVCGSLGFKYSGKKPWYIGINFNYFDQMYVEVNPVRRTLDAVDLVPYGSAEYNQILHQERLSAQFTMDLLGGYNWLLNRTFKNIDAKGKKHSYYLVFYGTVTNLTNNQNVVVAGREQLRYDYGQNNLDKFATQYRYMHGLGYFVSVAFKMQ
jgi:hypothetical protein